MKNEEIIQVLESCLGCGREHSCGVHGCRILRDAMELITVLEKR